MKRDEERYYHHYSIYPQNTVQSSYEVGIVQYYTYQVHKNWIRMSPPKENQPAVFGPSDVQVKVTEKSAKGDLQLCLCKDQPHLIAHGVHDSIAKNENHPR